MILSFSYGLYITEFFSLLFKWSIYNSNLMYQSRLIIILQFTNKIVYSENKIIPLKQYCFTIYRESNDAPIENNNRGFKFSKLFNNLNIVIF